MPIGNSNILMTLCVLDYPEEHTPKAIGVQPAPILHVRDYAGALVAAPQVWLT